MMRRSRENVKQYMMRNNEHARALSSLFTLIPFRMRPRMADFALFSFGGDMPNVTYSGEKRIIQIFSILSASTVDMCNKLPGPKRRRRNEN